MRTTRISLAALAFASGLAACGAPAVTGETETELAAPETAPEAVVASAETGVEEGDLMGLGGPSVDILPVFALPDEPGKLRLEFKDENEAYDIHGTIDGAIGSFDLALADQFMRAMAQESSNFAAYGTAAKAEAEALKAAGEDYFFPAPYGLSTQLRAAGQAGNLLSIYSTQYMYTGGAHGNYSMTGLTFQKGADVPEPLDAFIADTAALKALVIDGIVEQKIERGFADEERDIVRATATDALADDAAWTQNYVLNASSESGKFGGVTVLFSPYAIGSYAEGAYEITVPAETLKPLLQAELAGLFGGTPKPLPERSFAE
jgi:hypothetical protein